MRPRCPLFTAGDTVGKDKPDQQHDKQKKGRRRQKGDKNISGGRGEASDKVAYDQSNSCSTAEARGLTQHTDDR